MEYNLIELLKASCLKIGTFLVIDYACSEALNVLKSPKMNSSLDLFCHLRKNSSKLFTFQNIRIKTHQIQLDSKQQISKHKYKNSCYNAPNSKLHMTLFLRLILISLYSLFSWSTQCNFNIKNHHFFIIYLSNLFMTTLARNHRWRDLYTSERAITSLNFMNQINTNKSKQTSNPTSAHESLSSDRKSKSIINRFVAPVVLSRYKGFKLSSDSIRSRTLKLLTKQRQQGSPFKQPQVLNTERNQNVKHLREKIKEYTGRRKSRNQSRNQSSDNPQSNRKLINSRFIIKTKSSILSRFDSSKESKFLQSLNESRISNRKAQQSREQMQASRNGWSKIIKCLEI